MNHNQDDGTAATRRLRRTGSGRRAAHAATERTTMLYSRTQRELAGSSTTGQDHLTPDPSRPSSPWAGAAASRFPWTSANTNGGDGSRRSRKAKSASAGDPSRSAASASSANLPPGCPFAFSVDDQATLLDQARRGVGDKLAAAVSVEEYFQPYMIRPLTPAPRDSPSPSPSPSVALQPPPAWIRKQFSKILDGTPSPPPKYAQSLQTLYGHMSPANKSAPTSPTRSRRHPSVSLAALPPPIAVDAPHPHPSPAQRASQSPPDLTTSIPSPARQPPRNEDPPSPRQLVQSLDRQSDNGNEQWLPSGSAPRAPSANRTSLFDLTAHASQPHAAPRTEIIDLSDSDDDAQDVEMEDAQAQGGQVHHSGAADRKCELVDVIDSEDSSGSDDEVMRRPGRVLVNGLFDSPDLELESGSGQQGDDGGAGAVEEDFDSRCVSDRSHETPNQQLAPGFATMDMSIVAMDGRLSASHRPDAQSSSTHSEPARILSSTSPVRAAPHIPPPSSSHHARTPPPPPPPPQPILTPPAPPSTNPAVSSHASPIHLGDSDSDIEFVGETTITSPAAPTPHALSQPPSRSSAHAPASPSAASPSKLQLAPIFHMRKPKESASRSGRPSPRTASGGSSLSTSTPAHTPQAQALAPTTGSPSDDDEIVCLDPRPARSAHSPSAHVKVGGGARSGPSGHEPRSRLSPSHHSSRAPSPLPSATCAHGAGDTQSRRSHPSSRASSRAPSPPSSLRPEKMAASVAGMQSDDDEIVCVDPLPAKPMHSPAANANSGDGTASRSSHPGSRNPSRAASPPSPATFALDASDMQPGVDDNSARVTRPLSPTSSRGPSPSSSTRTPRGEKVTVSADAEGPPHITSPARADGGESSVSGAGEQSGGTVQQRKRKLDERIREDEGRVVDVIVLDDSDDEPETSKRRKVG